MGKLTVTSFITLDNVVEDPHLWSGQFQSDDNEGYTSGWDHDVMRETERGNPVVGYLPLPEGDPLEIPIQVYVDRASFGGAATVQGRRFTIIGTSAMSNTPARAIIAI